MYVLLHFCDIDFSSFVCTTMAMAVTIIKSWKSVDSICVGATTSLYFFSAMHHHTYQFRCATGNWSKLGYEENFWVSAIDRYVTMFPFDIFYIKLFSSSISFFSLCRSSHNKIVVSSYIFFLHLIHFLFNSFTLSMLFHAIGPQHREYTGFTHTLSFFSSSMIYFPSLSTVARLRSTVNCSVCVWSNRKVLFARCDFAWNFVIVSSLSCCSFHQLTTFGFFFVFTPCAHRFSLSHFGKYIMAWKYISCALYIMDFHWWRFVQASRIHRVFFYLCSVLSLSLCSTVLVHCLMP